MVKPMSRTHRNHQENIHRSGPLETGLYDLVKTKVGYNFIETLNRTLNSLIENNKKTFAIHAAIIFPHLLLCKTKSKNDGSLSKTIVRRLKQWEDGDLDGLYKEGKALQMRLLKGSRRKTEMKHTSSTN